MPAFLQPLFAGTSPCLTAEPRSQMSTGTVMACYDVKMSWPWVGPTRYPEEAGEKSGRARPLKHRRQSGGRSRALQSALRPSFDAVPVPSLAVFPAAEPRLDGSGSDMSEGRVNGEVGESKAEPCSGKKEGGSDVRGSRTTDSVASAGSNGADQGAAGEEPAGEAAAGGARGGKARSRPRPAPVASENHPAWLPPPPPVARPRATHNAAMLAYVGDSIYEMYARWHFLNPPVAIAGYSQRVMSVVCCEAQDLLLRRAQKAGFFTDEELDILRWGRNANTGARKAKGRAGSAVYANATALETLIGHLYLADTARLHQLMLALGFTCNSADLIVPASLFSKGKAPVG